MKGAAAGEAASQFARIELLWPRKDLTLMPR